LKLHFPCYGIIYGSRYSNSLFRIDTIFYDLPSTKTKRVTGLGYGRRFESLINPAMMASPPPTRYDLQSAFGGRSPQSRAFSFGLSREHFKKVYIKENLYTDPVVPGPGTYDMNNEKKLHEGLKYSLRPKTTKDSSFQNTTKGFPGPGTYELTATEDKSGFCFVSKYKSSTGTKIHVVSQGNLTGSDRIDVNMMKRSM
jgi:hypothetical protein